MIEVRKRMAKLLWAQPDNYCLEAAAAA